MKKLAQTLLLITPFFIAPWCFAQATTFPNKPVQVVLTSTPGSQSDTLMRFLSAEVAKSLGQPVVIVNQASAAGTIGADQVRRAQPDGHTLFLGGNTTMAANVHMMKNLSYDPVRDFEPITLVTTNPLVLVVKSSLPVNSVVELITYAKSRPAQLNFGVGNSGNKVATHLLESLAGIKATEISYKGATPAMVDLAGGQLDFIFADPVVADPFIKQGSIRALAVTAPIRLASMSTLPTMTEAGVRGYSDIASFLALYAPRGTPKPVIDALHDAFTKAINSKEGASFYERVGLVPKTSSTVALGEYTRDQIALWGQLVKMSGMQPQ